MAIIKDIVLWLYWIPFRKVAQVAPYGLLMALARFVGSVVFLILGKRRKARAAMLDELGVNGGMDAVRRSFQVDYQSWFETLIYPKLNPGNIGEIVEIEGKEILDTALEAGKGAILLFAHFGANQMVMAAIGHRGYAMCQLSTPPSVWVGVRKNANFSPMKRRSFEIQWELELSLPVTHINIFGSLKKAFVCLKDNGVLGLAMDGGGGKTRTVVEFFGRKALFSTGAMDIALRTRCAMIPVFMIRLADGRHRMILHKPLELDSGADHTAEAQRGTQLFARLLEDYTRRYPCHYLKFMAYRRMMEITENDTPFFVKDGAADDAGGASSHDEHAA
jgi:KDO2-lipid IV(A) lauroyltransferase